MSDQADHVSELEMLLGKPVLLLSWPLGTKGAPRKWGHLTPDEMSQPSYREKLRRGNIGVALGEVSGGLCAIDFDKDAFIEPFLALNPKLRATLQTQGARGRVFWLRLIGDYPSETKCLKTDSGEDVGEFRSNGSQSIIWGTHPVTKGPYKYVVKQPVVALEFSSIAWPSQIVSITLAPGCTEEQMNRRTEELRNQRTEELKSGRAREPRFFSSIRTVEDALRVSIPTEKNHNNQLLFKLARAIKALEQNGDSFDHAKLVAVFNMWYERARPFLREDQTKEDYFLEFMNAVHRAEHPLGGFRVGEAWEIANSQDLPSEAMIFSNSEMRLLIAFLKQMQAMAGDEPFFITSRTCAELLGHASHSTVVTWLGALCQMKYLVVVDRGNKRRAARYFYVWNHSDQ